MGLRHMQIGEVADRVGLSLRTIRYYEEVGIVPPSARSAGGFRLYTEDDVARLLLVKQMKPLDYTVEEIGQVLAVLDALRDPLADASQRGDLLDRLRMYHDSACQRVAALRAQAASAQQFADDLEAEVVRQQHTVVPEQ